MDIVPLRISYRVRYQAGNKQSITLKEHLHFLDSFVTNDQKEEWK